MTSTSTSTTETASPNPISLTTDGAGAITTTPPLARLPHLPAKLLKRHCCFIGTDTRFRAAARLLQSLHREDAGLAVGLHTSVSGTKRRRVRLGSRLPSPAAQAGHNLISPEVFRLVRRELVLREEGAVIDEDRLFGNMLSSMPLTFNVLGPMALDLSLATAVWRHLLPGFVHAIEAIGFEHSPGRGRAEFLDDGTAFDAVLQVVTPDGEPGLVFIEVKYSEGMSGPAAAHRPRYDEASRAVKLYGDPDSPALRSVALEQLWREHMLAQLAVQHGITPRAHFVVIGPCLNRQVGAAVKAYAAQLAKPLKDNSAHVGFSALTLETVIDALATAGATDIATLLQRRYLDFGRVLELALAEADGLTPTPPISGTSSRRARATATPPAEIASATPGSYVAPPRRTRERLPGQRTGRRVPAASASSSSTVTESAC